MTARNTPRLSYKHYLKPTAAKWIITGSVTKALCLSVAGGLAANSQPYWALAVGAFGAGLDELLKFFPAEG